MIVHNYNAQESKQNVPLGDFRLYYLKYNIERTIVLLLSCVGF